MEKLLSLESFRWFLILVFPGLISMHVYRLFMPARPIEWKTAILEAFFYSAVNFAICLPVIAWMFFGHAEDHPIWAGFAGYLVFLIGPILWPWVWVRFSKSPLMKKLQLPYPTAWDAYFDRREECFLLITLRNGDRVGGFFGPGSYASSFPNDGDIYMSAVYKLDRQGNFLEAIPDTKGLLIRKDEYSLIEFFAVPKVEST
jgi:Family of unknown function (DUF6338)